MHVTITTSTIIFNHIKNIYLKNSSINARQTQAHWIRLNPSYYEIFSRAIPNQSEKNFESGLMQIG